MLSLDPDNTRSGRIFLDLDALGLEGGGPAGQPIFAAHDELTGATFEWGAEPFFSLDPHTMPGHACSIAPFGG